jgi:hypothetical protein
MNKSKPLVSVIMPVYNGEKYLREAIESILDQTFTNFEFIIIDDGSTDGSLKIIKYFSGQDTRVRLIINKTNLGVAARLNQGIVASRGEYIARMDADDISLPRRFESQLAFLDSHPQVGVLGTAAYIIDQYGKINGSVRFPSNHLLLLWHLCFFENPIIHPSVIMRRNLINQMSVYNLDVSNAEDLNLWCRLSSKTRLANLPDIYFCLRKHEDNISLKKWSEQKRWTLENSRQLLSEILKDEITLAQLEGACQAVWAPVNANPQDFFQLAQLKYMLGCVLLTAAGFSCQEKIKLGQAASRELQELSKRVHGILPRKKIKRWINEINAIGMQSSKNKSYSLEKEKSHPVDDFNNDPYPGKPKILFIGLCESTHTQSWIDLLENSEINVRLFALPSGFYPPERWKTRVYLSKNRRKWYKPIPEIETGNLFSKVKRLYQTGLSIEPDSQKLARFLLETPKSVYTALVKIFIFSSLTIIRLLQSNPEKWLASIIQEWQPDIIHTLGTFDNQGGEFYYKVRKKYNLESYGKWVLQLSGGSDLTLRRHDPEMIPHILNYLTECDVIVSDNRSNISYASKLGIPVEKFSSITPVPGIGGLDIENLAQLWQVKPFHRERMILWPKGYDSQWSLALPVLEAIKLCWDEIKPCKIYILAATQELRAWVMALPKEIRQNCIIQDRIPRDEVIRLMLRARVMLAPSMIDGLPNVLLEAMACGAFPIVSPLETITPIVCQEKNVLFARNLYPEEISNAITKAMNDDDLVDKAVVRNLKLVVVIADRKKIREKVKKFYLSILK